MTYFDPVKLLHRPGNPDNPPRTLTAEQQRQLDHYSELASSFLEGKVPQRTIDVELVLIEAAVLTETGISIKDAMRIFLFTRQTFYTRARELEQYLPIIRTQPGREKMYRADLEAIDRLAVR